MQPNTPPLGALAVFSAVLLSIAAPTRAQVRGMYSPGSALTQAGTLGDPGFAYNHQF
jgi:hypothetical protein